MGIKIYEGVIDRTGNARVDGGSTTYEFIEIGGQRVRKVVVDDYLDSFITVGDRVALSCTTGWGSPTRVYAVREPNGQISKQGTSFLNIFSVIMFGCTLLITLIPMIFVFGIMESFTPFYPWMAGSVLVVWLGMRNHYKARNALDALEKEVPPAAAA